MTKKEFSITFWIRLKNNPKWNDIESDINFPPINGPQGTKIFFSKYRNLLKVYVLHPDIGYRKMTADITKYIGKDAFIAITNAELLTKLYINAELVDSFDKNSGDIDIEVDDYVMVNLRNQDVTKITIGPEVQDFVMPAKVNKIVSDKSLAVLFLFEIDEVVELPLDRIRY
jgi:hypothetical protein